MIRPTERQVLSAHKMMIEETGGLDGVRDMNLLQSALNAPFQSFKGEEVYPSLLSKAAAIAVRLFQIPRLSTETNEQGFTLC